MSTYERLHQILVAEYRLPAEKLAPAARLDELGVDSLGLMELLFKVEDEFGIRLPAEQVELPTIGDVAQYIDRLMLEQRTGQATERKAAGASTGAGG